MASDSHELRVVDRCRPFPRPPVAVVVAVRLSMSFGELVEHLRCELLAPLTNAMEYNPGALRAHLESFFKERDNMYQKGCVALTLAPVDEFTHGALFAARTDQTTVAELKLDSLRGRLSMEPIVLPIVMACPFVPVQDGAFAAAVRAAQAIAAFKMRDEQSLTLPWAWDARCLWWFATRFEVGARLGEDDATVYAISWGRLLRTREGFAKYPRAVRQQVFLLLLMRNRGVFGGMDRNVCFLIADYVVSLPQPFLWEGTASEGSESDRGDELRSFGSL